MKFFTATLGTETNSYAAAPTAVSMLHGGVLKATGAYCALRFGIQLLPDAAHTFMPFIAIFCVRVGYTAVESVS